MIPAYGMKRFGQDSQLTSKTLRVSSAEAEVIPDLADPNSHKLQMRPSPVGQLLGLPLTRISATVATHRPDLPALSPAVTSPTDEEKEKIERDFCEFRDQDTGTIRRRSLMRCVAEEDHLLARGANPRTGFVSPGIQIADCRSKEFGILGARGLPLPSKWRQRREQWVSLELDGQTPLPSPAHGPRKHQLQDVPVAKHHLIAQPVPASLIYTSDRKDGRGTVPLPGAFPVTPFQAAPMADVSTSPVTHPIIKRKPVGSPPSGQSASEVRTSTSLGTMTPRQTIPPQLRSSSTPVKSSACEHSHLACADKALPNLPVHPTPVGTGTINGIQHCQNTRFSEMKRGYWVEDVPQFAATTKGDPDKDLPSVPDPLTDDGQYQYPRLVERQSKARPRPPMPSQPAPRANALVGPRGGNPTYPYIRSGEPPIPPRHYNLNQYTQDDMDKRTRLDQVPFYESPPRPNPYVTKEAAMGAFQRRLNGVRTALDEGDIFTSSPRMKPMTTNASPNTLSTRHIPLVRGTKPQVTSFTQQMQNLSQHPSIEPRTTSMPLPRLRQQGAPRPQVLERPDKTHRVPKVSPQGSRQELMVNRHQWRMIGTNEGGVCDESEGTLEPKPHVADPRVVVDPMRPISRGRVEKIDPTLQMNGTDKANPSRMTGLTKKCSICDHGLVRDERCTVGGPILVLNRKTSGRAEAEIGRRDETTKEVRPERLSGSPMPGNAATFPSVHREGRDHAACCTECCQTEDCHDSCLGHPSPSQPAPRSRQREDAECNGSPTPSIVSQNIQKTPKSPLRLRTSITGIFGFKLSGGKNEGKSSPPPVSPHAPPILPAAVWGGDGTTSAFAVNAAKTAIGLHGSSSTNEGLHDKINAAKAASSKTTGAGANQARRVISEPKALCFSGTSRLAKRNEKTYLGEANVVRSAADSDGRHPSGTSLKAVIVPEIDTWLEMVNVPFAALFMWVSHHPNLNLYGRVALERMVEMAKIISSTVKRLWEVAYVYSKTGKLRVKGDAWTSLGWDCARSAAYLILFLGIGVLVMRIAWVVVRVLRCVLWVVSGVVWVVRKAGFGGMW